MKTKFEHVIRKCASGWFVECWRPGGKEPWIVTSCFSRSGAAVNAALEEAKLLDLGLSYRFVDGWPVTDPPQPNILAQIDQAARLIGFEPVGEWTEQ